MAEVAEVAELLFLATMTRYTPLMLKPSSLRWPFAFATSGHAASYLAHASGSSPEFSISVSRSHTGSAQ